MIEFILPIVLTSLLFKLEANNSATKQKLSAQYAKTSVSRLMCFNNLSI